MLRRRFTIFCLLFGLGLTALFVLSDMAGSVNYWFLVLGAFFILVAIGILITVPGPPPGESPARFRLLKRIMEREQKEKDKATKKP